jgi:NitT/TauT family transport system permease protein
MTQAALHPTAPVAVDQLPDVSVSSGRSRVRDLGAIAGVFLVIIAFWYVGAIYYNWGSLALHYSDLGQASVWQHMSYLDKVRATLNEPLPTLPTPHQVLANLWSRLAEPPSANGNLWVDFATTGTEAVLGFLVGAVLAIVLAFAFVRSRILELSLFPYVVMSQTVPIVALVPALVVALGLGLRAKVLVAAYLAFYPITVSAVKGLRSVDPLAEELMRSYAASSRQVFLKLRLPSALPYIFTGLKIGITASVIGAIISELPVGSQFGFGRAIIDASQYGLNILLWSTIVASGLLGLVLYGCVVLFERMIVRTRLEDA